MSTTLTQAHRAAKSYQLPNHQFHNSTDYTGSSIYLPSLPEQTSVYDGSSGIERARTRFEYDNYVPDEGNLHAGIVTRSGISGLCDGTSQNCPGGPISLTAVNLTRGNPTKTTRYLLDASGNVTSSVNAYAQFDVAGNLVKVIDCRSTPTNIIATPSISPIASARRMAKRKQTAGLLN